MEIYAKTVELCMLGFSSFTAARDGNLTQLKALIEMRQASVHDIKNGETLLQVSKSCFSQYISSYQCSLAHLMRTAVAMGRLDICRSTSSNQLSYDGNISCDFKLPVRDCQVLVDEYEVELEIHALKMFIGPKDELIPYKKP